MLLLDDKSILLSFRMQGLGVAKTLQFLRFPKKVDSDCLIPAFCSGL